MKIKFTGHADPIRLIQEATNVARWNAPLAAQWMDEASARVMSPIHIKEYNKAVDRINRTWDSIESAPYYPLSIKYADDMEDMLWQFDKPRRLTKLEEVFSMEDYLAGKAIP